MAMAPVTVVYRSGENADRTTWQEYGHTETHWLDAARVMTAVESLINTEIIRVECADLESFKAYWQTLMPQPANGRVWRY